MFPKFLTIVLKPIDNICNLKCKYCYARTEFGGYSHASDLKQLLIEEWFPILLKKLNLAPELKHVHFVWQGGEPLLLPKSVFEKAVFWQKILLRKDIKCSNAVQTNGLLLDKDYATFLTDMEIHIGLSIDGPEYHHNRKRFDSYETFTKVLDNIWNLSSWKIPFSLFFVIHEDNCQDAKSIMHFIDQVNPLNGVAFPPRFTSDTSFLKPDACRAFLIQLFKLWWPKRTVYISIFEHILEGLQGKVPVLCYLVGRCNSYISLDSQGNVYSTCEVHSSLKIGNILSDSIDSLKAYHYNMIQRCMTKFSNDSLFELLCLNKRYIYFQGKGCPNRLVKGKDPYTWVFAELISFIDELINKS